MTFVARLCLPTLYCERRSANGPTISEILENSYLLTYNCRMPLSSSSDDSLVLRQCLERMRAGDIQSRDQLLQHCNDRFERLARSMLRNFPGVQKWEQTGDVLQNSLLRLLKALDTVQPESLRHFLALAATQIRRELIDLARRYQGPHSPVANQMSHDFAAASSLQADLAEPADLTHEPLRLAAWGELHDRIAALPTEEREVCDLLWYHGFTQPEAANVLEVSERTVKRRWQAVRLKLHEQLQGRLS